MEHHSEFNRIVKIRSGLLHHFNNRRYLKTPELSGKIVPPAAGNKMKCECIIDHGIEVEGLDSDTGMTGRHIKKTGLFFYKIQEQRGSVQFHAGFASGCFSLQYLSNS